jgi:hypothetical protein
VYRLRKGVTARPIFWQSECKNVIRSTAFFSEIRYEISPSSSTFVYFMKCRVTLCTVHHHLIFLLGLDFSQRAIQALRSIWKTKHVYMLVVAHPVICQGTWRMRCWERHNRNEDGVIQRCTTRKNCFRFLKNVIFVSKATKNGPKLNTNFEELNSYKLCFGNRKRRDQLGQ